MIKATHHPCSIVQSDFILWVLMHDPVENLHVVTGFSALHGAEYFEMFGKCAAVLKTHGVWLIEIQIPE